MRRLCGEHGVALPMALGVMLVLSIVVFAVIEFSSANTRNSSLNERRQSAKALAEAGVNHGASVIANELATDANFSADRSGTASIQGVSIPWTATFEGGSPKTWLVSATATLANPTGPIASAVPRTVQAKFAWTSVPDFEAWKGIFVESQGSDCIMQNKAVVKTPMYVKAGSGGTVCIKDDGTRYLGPYFAVVGRFKSESSGATIGQPASASEPGDPNYPNEYRVPDVHISGGCGSSSSPITPCTESHKVYRCLTTPDPPCYSHVVPVLPKPTHDFPYWEANAKPGPGTVGSGPGKWPNGCTTYSGSPPSFTSGTFNLMSSSSYNCEVDVEGDGVLEGQLKWDTSTNPGTLTIKGTMYAKGNMILKDRHGVVSGKGTIYIKGEVDMESNGSLCGQTDTSNGVSTRPYCDQRAVADGGWDPGNTDNLIWFIVGSTHTEAVDIKNDGFEFQGGLYVVGGFMLQNSATFKGPLIANKIQLKNDSVVDAWTPLNILLPGVPSGGSANALTLVKGSWTG